MGDSARSFVFHINAGMRQGCVFNPRLFCATLGWAMRSWQDSMDGKGIDLHDDLGRLLDLKFCLILITPLGKAQKLLGGGRAVRRRFRTAKP